MQNPQIFDKGFPYLRNCNFHGNPISESVYGALSFLCVKKIILRESFLSAKNGLYNHKLKPKNMKSKFFFYLLPILGLIAICYSFIAPTMEKKLCDNSSAGVELKTDMRRLWDDHVVWTRNVIFNIIDDLPGTDEAVTRLMKNQDDIGNAIKPYYGEEAGKKLTDLLHTHIAQAADLLKAAKKDDNVAFEEVNKKWKANADEIAAFLSKANPNWKLAEMKKMMQDHLALTTEEAVARKKKDYAADVMAFDKVDEEILKMSDMLSMGIVTQFPEKFKSTKDVGSK